MVKDRPLRDFMSELTGRRPFTLSRWGDHEWAAMLGTGGWWPPDGHLYLPDLQKDLWRVLNDRPPYRLALGTTEAAAVNTITAAELHDLDWHRDPFSRITDVSHPLLELTRAVRGKPLVVVGPPKYRHLRARLDWAAFVDVPPKNAYLAKDHLVRETLAALDDLREPGLVSVSAGVCAPLVIDAVYKVAGHFHQLVDFGGVWGEYLNGEHRERAG